MKIKLLKIVSCAVFFLLVFTSCKISRNPNFTTEEEAETYSLEYMEDKHGIEFKIAESRYRPEYESYWGIMESADGQYKDIEFHSRVHNELLDSFYKVYFEADALKMVEDFIDSTNIGNMVSYTVKFDTQLSWKKWTGEEPLKSYLSPLHSTAHIIVNFGEGYNYKEYGKQFLNCMIALSELEMSKDFRVQINGSHPEYVAIYRTKWETPNKNRLKALDAAAIGCISRLANESLYNPLEDLSWIKESYVSREGEEDFYWGKGETTDSYMNRNNLYAEYMAEFEEGLTPEELADRTFQIFEIIKNEPYPKMVTIWNEYIPINEMGVFIFEDTYSEKTKDEVIADYKQVIKEYEDWKKDRGD